jgi:tetratricopeptide (TPR) repeat protein
MDRTIALAIAAAAALAFASQAEAAMTVIGSPAGEACWHAAKAVSTVQRRAAPDPGLVDRSVAVCDEALGGGALTPRDTAATYVNRGILQMSVDSREAAAASFNAALGVIPTLGEAHVNLGALMVRMQRYPEAVREIELGIAQMSQAPQLAWYDLGVAYEGMGDLQKAYDAYKTASAMDPNWQTPKDDLARFTVRPAQP